MTTLFDTYLMIDWSAAAKPRSGTDSIWCALLDRSEDFTALKDPKTRRIARDCLGSILDALLEGGQAHRLEESLAQLVEQRRPPGGVQVDQPVDPREGHRRGVEYDPVVGRRRPAAFRRAAARTVRSRARDWSAPARRRGPPPGSGRAGGCRHGADATSCACRCTAAASLPVAASFSTAQAPRLQRFPLTPEAACEGDLRGVEK